MPSYQVASFFLLAELGKHLLDFLQMTQVHADPVDINVDTLLLPFSLDLGDGVISLFFLPVVTDRLISQNRRDRQDYRPV